ncbi:hypothetical protein GBAR_LOCUS3004 [Geodia barretti]|uniref:Uncharacterized protein n=1 Tax=Geodia barretti TaxID=519541 RepID=A0AA35R1N3_GEOBA|nr:hypothetical protein GBAR_LOCUS3004 [Geodia barretti]
MLVEKRGLCLFHSIASGEDQVFCSTSYCSSSSPPQPLHLSPPPLPPLQGVGN